MVRKYITAIVLIFLIILFFVKPAGANQCTVDEIVTRFPSRKTSSYESQRFLYYISGNLQIMGWDPLIYQYSTVMKLSQDDPCDTTFVNVSGHNLIAYKNRNSTGSVLTDFPQQNIDLLIVTPYDVLFTDISSGEGMHSFTAINVCALMKFASQYQPGQHNIAIALVSGHHQLSAGLHSLLEELELSGIEIKNALALENLRNSGSLVLLRHDTGTTVYKPEMTLTWYDNTPAAMFERINQNRDTSLIPIPVESRAAELPIPTSSFYDQKVSQGEGLIFNNLGIQCISLGSDEPGKLAEAILDYSENPDNSQDLTPMSHLLPVSTYRGIHLIHLDTLNKAGLLFSLGGLATAILCSLHLSGTPRKKLHLLISIGHLAIYAGITAVTYIGYLLGNMSAPGLYSLQNLYAHIAFIIVAAIFGFLVLTSVKNRVRKDTPQDLPSPLAGFWGLVIISALTRAAGIIEHQLVLYLTVSTCILATALIIESIQTRIKLQRGINAFVIFIRIALYLTSAVPVLYFAANGINTITRNTFMLSLAQDGLFAIISALGVVISISAIFSSFKLPVLSGNAWTRYKLGICYGVTLFALAISILGIVNSKPETQSVTLGFPRENREINVTLKDNDPDSPAFMTHRQIETGVRVSYEFIERPDYYTITLTNLRNSSDLMTINTDCPELPEIGLSPCQSLTLICWMPDNRQIDRTIEVQWAGTNPQMELKSQFTYLEVQSPGVYVATVTTYESTF